MVAELEAACAATELTDLVALPNDLTNFVFDNQYYIDARNGRGLFTIDAELALDSRTADIQQTFANDQQAFFDTFTTAFVKMTSRGVLTGNEGQIRQNCHFVNTESRTYESSTHMSILTGDLCIVSQKRHS